MIYTDLGRRVRTARQARSLTQEQLAEAVDVSAGYLRSIERGEKIPSLGVISRIACTLGVSMGLLLDPLPEPTDEQELVDVMSDCTSVEQRIIIEIAMGAKQTLRKYAI